MMLCTPFLSPPTSITAQKKATYDKFGEEGLKGGIPEEAGENGAWTEGYTYHENPEKIFRQFFGGDNPFAGIWAQVLHNTLKYICIEFESLFPPLKLLPDTSSRFPH